MKPSLIILFFCALVVPTSLSAAGVSVRFREGLVHGFLVLRSPEGKTLADGDLIQVAHGDRVTSRLTFHFKDGSLHDETAVFSQHGAFRLLSDHLIQSGPSFEHPMEVTINTSSGKITVQYKEDGKDKIETEHLHLPPDIANGMILVLMKNIPPDAPETTISMVAATPKPRLIKLKITPQAEESFSTGDAKRKGMHFIVKVDLGGLTGLLASVFGKQPPDINVWILQGEAPAFVKSEGPLSVGGPIWRIELVSPVWPQAATETPAR